MTQRIESNKSEMSRLQRVEATNGDLQEAIAATRVERQAALDQLADAKFEIQQQQSDAERARAEHGASADKLQAQLASYREQVCACLGSWQRLPRGQMRCMPQCCARLVQLIDTFGSSIGTRLALATALAMAAVMARAARAGAAAVAVFVMAVLAGRVARGRQRTPPAAIHRLFRHERPHCCQRGP